MSVNYIQPIIFSLIVIAAYFLFNWLLLKAITVFGESKRVPKLRYIHVYKYFRFILWILTAVVLMVVWGLDYKGLIVLASSVLALLAVALVAQWSILSNITSGVLIFFTFPARIGNAIEIIDGTSSITGEIIEITLFQTLLKQKDGEIVSYPNSLLLQKAVRIHQKKSNKTTKPRVSLRSRVSDRKPQ